MAVAIRGRPSTNMEHPLVIETTVIQIVGHRLSPRGGGTLSVIKSVGRCPEGTASLWYRFGIIKEYHDLGYILIIQ